MYSISEQLLTMNRPKTSLNPQGFVIHATDTPGATAQNEHDYFNSAYRGASAHYFVDSAEIIRVIPENEVAWHAGKTANKKFLSVEMCDTSPFEEVWKRTVWLVADACKKYGWNTQDNVFSHRGTSQMYHETDHTDPIQFLADHGKTWEELLSAIDQEISGEVETVTENNDPDEFLTVRVRASKADAVAQQIIDLGYACKKLDLP